MLQRLGGKRMDVTKPSIDHAKHSHVLEMQEIKTLEMQEIKTLMKF
jgi:hypothetical protein